MSTKTTKAPKTATITLTEQTQAEFDAFCERYRMPPDDAIDALLKGWRKLEPGQQYDAIQLPLPADPDAHRRRVDAHLAGVRSRRGRSRSAV